jgi:hypothetical protein
MKIIIAIAALALTGCAHEYAAYADAQKAQAQAQAAKYAALAEIAKMGDTTAKVAAVMSINGFGGQQQQQISPPRHWADYALSFTGALLPVVGQVYAVNKQSAVAIAQSNNATTLGIAQTNSNRDVQTATSTAFVSMATTGFKTATDIASKIQAPQANITLSGTGVIGSGTYTQTTMSGTGVLGTGTYSTDTHPIDNHAVSTSTSSSTSLTCTTGPC